MAEHVASLGVSARQKSREELLIAPRNVLHRRPPGNRVHLPDVQRDVWVPRPSQNELNVATAESGSASFVVAFDVFLDLMKEKV